MIRNSAHKLRNARNTNNYSLPWYNSHVKLISIFLLFLSLGLIRARLAGARLAKADTLVFLDAHCECVVQWLEPLMERIKEKPTSVLVPIIDVIEAKNFYYSTNGYDTFQVSCLCDTLLKTKLHQNNEMLVAACKENLKSHRNRLNSEERVEKRKK